VGLFRHKATEIAADLPRTFDRNPVAVFCASIHQLTQVEGIGFVKACKIKAAFELVFLLDSKNRLIRHQRISLGSLNTALVHPRDVFRPAIAEGAASIILVHNHPSGDPTPSKQDHLLTREPYMCGKVLGIEVVDYVIIGFSDHVSLKDRKLM